MLWNCRGFETSDLISTCMFIDLLDLSIDLFKTYGHARSLTVSRASSCGETWSQNIVLVNGPHLVRSYVLFTSYSLLWLLITRFIHFFTYVLIVHFFILCIFMLFTFHSLYRSYTFIHFTSLVITFHTYLTFSSLDTIFVFTIGIVAHYRFHSTKSVVTVDS